MHAALPSLWGGSPDPGPPTVLKIRLLVSEADDWWGHSVLMVAVPFPLVPVVEIQCLRPFEGTFQLFRVYI